MRKILFAIFLCTNLFAIEFDGPKILARSNINNNYNLPVRAMLSNTNPVINNKGDIAFKVIYSGVEEVQGIWAKGYEDPEGKLLIYSFGELGISDPTIDEDGKIYYSLFDEGSTEGVYRFNIRDFITEKLIDPTQFDFMFYTYTQGEKNKLKFRGTSKDNLRSFNEYDLSTKELKELVAEGKNGVSYLFRPSYTKEGKIYFKARLGEIGEWEENRPDILYSFHNQKLNQEVFDHNYNTTSEFFAFLNSVDVSENEHLVFTALTKDGRLAINYLDRSKKVHQIAIENSEDLLNIENFPAKINNSGHVLFRGKDGELKRSIFFWDGDKLTKIISEGQEVMTDLGMARIVLNPNFPGFSGEIDFNDFDQIVFSATLVTIKENKDLGLGVFLINPKDWSKK